MDLQDLIKQAAQEESKEESKVEESVTLVDLDEVEKTAELLEHLSEEDTAVDEIAKLAVLNDFLVNQTTSMEKCAGWWDRLMMQFAKSPADMKNARRAVEQAQKMKQLKAELKLANKELDLAQLTKEIEQVTQKAEGRGGSFFTLPAAVLGLGAAGAGGYATKLYLDKQYNEDMKNVAEKYFYAGAEASQTGGAV